MRCPYCSTDNTRVIDSRPSEENNSIRRRRQCDACGRRFTTYERIETIPLMVIKKDDNREPYNRAKIESGIMRACHKRPVSAGVLRFHLTAILLQKRELFQVSSVETDAQQQPEAECARR